MAAIRVKSGVDLETVRQKFLSLISLINTRVIGMPEVVKGVAIGMLAGEDPRYGEHTFLIGPPGVGKSYVMNVWASCIELNGPQLFDYLLHPFSTAEELVGEYDIKKLFNESIKIRNVEGFLPAAVFAILDEIWKSGPVSTMLFQITNERKFKNGATTIDCPLISALSASNEFPAKKTEMPLWDRLLLRYKVDGIWDPESVKQIQAAKRRPWTPTKLTLPEIYAAKKAAYAVELAPATEDALLQFHLLLYKMGIVLSNRRRDKMYGVVRASAWLAGRSVATLEDLGAIWPCCWENEKEIPSVRRALFKLTNRDLSMLLTQQDLAEKIYKGVEARIGDYQKSLETGDGQGNPALLGGEDSVEKAEMNVADILDKIALRRKSMDEATQADADNIISLIEKMHRELVTYSTISRNFRELKN